MHQPPARLVTPHHQLPSQPTLLDRLPPTPADLAGAQYVYIRWFQPLVASYEPLVDRRLAESKALSSEWLHSNALRLVAAMQQRALAWLASLQLQAAEAAGGGALPAAPAARRPAPIVEELESDDEDEVVVVRETRSRRRAAAPAPKRASSRGGRGEGERAGASGRGDAYAVPGDELQSRRSSFSLVGAGRCWGCDGGSSLSTGCWQCCWCRVAGLERICWPAGCSHTTWPCVLTRPHCSLNPAGHLLLGALLRPAAAGPESRAQGGWRRCAA